MKVLLFLLILSSNLYPAQPAFHVLAGYHTNKFIATQFEGNPLFTSPISGIASHYIADRFIGEGSIDYAIDIAIVRTFIMFMVTPEKEKDAFLWVAFWSLFPDLLDKGLGTSYFHNKNESNLVPLSPGITNLAEEFSVLFFSLEFQ